MYSRFLFENKAWHLTYSVLDKMLDLIEETLSERIERLNLNPSFHIIHVSYH